MRNGWGTVFGILLGFFAGSTGAVIAGWLYEHSGPARKMTTLDDFVELGILIVFIGGGIYFGFRSGAALEKAYQRPPNK